VVGLLYDLFRGDLRYALVICCQANLLACVAYLRAASATPNLSET